MREREINCTLDLTKIDYDILNKPILSVYDEAS